MLPAGSSASVCASYTIHPVSSTNLTHVLSNRVVNVGLISWASYSLYVNPFLRRDARFLGADSEGYAAKRYTKTPRGQDEVRRAKLDGAALYCHSREAILRPGVLGCLLGVVNVAVLGTVGDTSHQRRRYH